MPVFILYLLKFSISLGCMYLFYLLLLRPLTFYQWNRCYLALYSLVSFLIPFIDIGPLLTGKLPLDTQLINAIPAVTYITSSTYIDPVSSDDGINYWNIALL